ncbi:hypothetical protein [Campylobacter ureolyticus]|uniref:hypothetical protein n=1 Tax=Campylobacter ureolyticus TaxID=827 RepID=UPI00291164AF|nr:hypothetical protein [Campylobacter ureolyticus]MDU7071438.1 hypothetical protein [Campylobacter ureolyticus]
MKFDTSVMCLSPNFGGMEIDSLKLTKKLSKYKNIILIAKKDSFISENFNEFLKDTQNAKLEIVDFKNFFSLSLIKQVRGLIKKYKLKNLIFFGARELKSLHFALRGGVVLIS